MQVRVSSGVTIASTLRSLQGTIRAVVSLLPAARPGTAATPPLPPGPNLIGAVRHHFGVLPPLPTPGMRTGHVPVRAGGPTGQALLDPANLPTPADVVIDGMGLGGMLVPDGSSQSAPRLAAIVVRAFDLLLPPGELPDAGALPGATSADADSALRVDAPILPLQPPPPPPPGPTLTLDPSLGTIVWNDEGTSGDPASGGSATGGTDDDPQPLVPTSWVPVPGPLLRDVGARFGRTASALSSYARERGISRWHLLVLAVVAPFATAFLIDAVETLLG